MPNKVSPSFAALLQEYFTEYLVSQRALSPRTVVAYRDAFALLLGFAAGQLGKSPAHFQIAELDRALILAFLDSLERERSNSVRTRNHRLAAIRSFLKFAARRDVSSLHVIEQTLAVPMKRFDRPLLGFLSREEMLAVIDAPAIDTWLGQRDRLLFTMLYNTGARVSEIIGVRVRDVVLVGAPCVHLHGKGRKQRSVPLWATTVRALRTWLHRNGEPGPESPLLTTRAGHAMTRANVSQRLRLAVDAIVPRYPDLTGRSISPHTIRHTTAMHLLQSGVDVTVIALWLGHESPSTTHMYVEADLAMKERALSRLTAPDVKTGRYQPPDALMRFLQAL